jgi:SAM-dependent methyltransferase
MAERTQPHQHAECVFETELATKLRGASRTERMSLYGEVYDAYTKAFPYAMPETPDDHLSSDIAYELAFAKKFISSDMAVAEVGPGRCAFARALAEHCKVLYGIDVTDLSPAGLMPSNFRHVLIDGVHIPLPDESVDVVVSNQLMEHLHPDDAADQLNEIARILRVGGHYICVTPNRLHGPHDSSARFDDLPCPIVDGTYIATGLHLKEYTNAELSELFRASGFRNWQTYAGARGKHVQVPVALMKSAERLSRLIPIKLRTRSRLLRILLGVRIVGQK